MARNSPRLINLWPSDSRSNWNLEMLVFEERGKPEYRRKTSRSKDENQQQTQPTFDAESGRPAWEANAQPLCHPCSPKEDHIITCYTRYFILITILVLILLIYANAFAHPLTHPSSSSSCSCLSS